MEKDFEEDALFVYEPYSWDINYIGICGEVCSFLVLGFSIVSLSPYFTKGIRQPP